MDPSLPQRGRSGEAIGLISYARPDGGYDWHVEACRVSIDPDLTRYRMCVVVVHEVGHLVHGPEHTGPMAADALRPADCTTPSLKTLAEQIDEILRDYFDEPDEWLLACTPVVNGYCRCRATHPLHEAMRFAVEIQGDVVMSTAVIEPRARPVRRTRPRPARAKVSRRERRTASRRAAARERAHAADPEPG